MTSYDPTTAPTNTAPTNTASITTVPRAAVAQTAPARRARTVVAAAAATAAAALLLGACGTAGSGAGHEGGHRPGPGGTATVSGAPSGSPSAAPGTAEGTPNAADTAFAQGMVPHHRQALEMAELVPDRSASPRVRALAEEIRRAQDPEIATLTGWLRAWGQPVPEGGGHAGHAMPGATGESGTAGMMTGREMADLAAAEGAAFDRAFLTLMVRHHEGAVSMARDELARGAYGPAKKMAGAIVGSQSAEIARMKKLLAGG
ncbi:DUF305 domain-containing protein [Streptomyces sp. NPDC097619]|uniref:DUF305 domain-containing protein n=1 Tax=Streptomyces sp. NPDC097619 TaxID=3157228 RepID=UPI003318F4F9